ncbi:MAG: DUF3788 family protein [Flavobacterium sp.]|nr:MAG: DUF3788 family protein [Flavobacterium sp.]
MKSIFTDKNAVPTSTDLQLALGNSFQFWQELEVFAKKSYPGYVEEWSFSPKFGWSYRLKDSKRVIVYLLPRDNFFKVAFVFGEKATNTIIDSAVSEAIKKELLSAKVYAEGRGIRLVVTSDNNVADIKSLIEIKIKA